jgi:hypothetical protein
VCESYILPAMVSVCHFPALPSGRCSRSPVLRHPWSSITRHSRASGNPLQPAHHTSDRVRSSRLRMIPSPFARNRIGAADGYAHARLSLTLFLHEWECRRRRTVCEGELRRALGIHPSLV